MKSSIHGLSKPDVLAVLALAGPPVLFRYRGNAWVDASGSSFHVTEYLDGIGCAAKVRVNPVVAWSNRKKTFQDLYTTAITKRKNGRYIAVIVACIDELLLSCFNNLGTFKKK